MRSSPAQSTRACSRPAGGRSVSRFFELARLTLAATALAVCAVPSAAQSAAAVPALFGHRPRIDGQRMLADLGVLAHDSLEGRRTGTAGAERARRFLTQTMERRGIAALPSGRTRAFQSGGRGANEAQSGVNVIGVVRGTAQPERYIVVTAHYDHLGVREGQVFNGADDNASGTAAILALADWMRAHPPRNSFLFVALDAEETGLRGARAFVSDPPVPLASIVMNVNLDMVSRSAKNELYAAGTYHYGVLRPLVDEAKAISKISLLTGHDSPGLPPGDDWTDSSDHGPFHQAGIPFVYFGVEDHPGYHRATDDAADITPAFYVEAIETVLDFLLLADRDAERIQQARRP